MKKFAKCVFIVMNTPAEGRANELDDWHESVHMREVVKAPGWVSVQRCHLADVQVEEPGLLPGDPERLAQPRADPWPFLNIYEVYTDDPEAMLAALSKDTQENQQPLPEGVFNWEDKQHYFFYKAISERVESPPDTHPFVEDKDAELAFARRERRR